jgi:transcription elongation GreA/GreB family factor
MISQSICQIGRSRRIRTSSHLKVSPRLKGKLAALAQAHRAAVDKHDKAAIAAAQRELRYWSARRGTAKLVEPPADRTHIHFGMRVVVRREYGRTQAFRIVGEDEADPSRGTVSHVSPLARAVMGKSAGDVVTVLGREAKILEIH